MPLVSLIHSVSTMSVVQEIEARAANATEVLLEVNIAGEESKSGIAPAAADAFLEEAAACGKVRFCGLMCMPPLSDDADAARPYFAQTRELARATFDNVAGNVYFRPAIDGYECRLRGRRARRRDHRARRQRALLTR